MKKNIFRGIGVSAALLAALVFGSGCAPYNAPKFDMVAANETVFIIPLNEKTNNQAQWQSQDFLKKHQVSTKRIQIPRLWVQTGRTTGDGYYQDTVQDIHVPLSPVTREWTSDSTGTGGQDQGIRGHTLEGNGFTAHMNVSAQVKEEDASTFLHWFGAGTQDKDGIWTSTLETVMDKKIRPLVAADFVAETSHYTMSQFMSNEDAIMKKVYQEVDAYCQQNGITLTLLGLQGQVKWDNPKIQESLDANSQAIIATKTQNATNQQVIEKAQADAQAAKIMASVNNSQFTQYNLKLKELDLEKQRLENEAAYIAKWNGVKSNTEVNMGSGSGTSFQLQLPSEPGK